MKYTLLFAALLTLCANVTRSAENVFRVGAARIEESGSLGPSQMGKYDHEHLYARAIVLDNGKTRAGLISYDGPESDFAMGATIKAVAAALNCTPTNIIITHTHTHSATAGPMVFPGMSAEPTRPAAKIIEAAKQARSNLQVARMAYGTGRLYLNVNRDAIDPATRKWTQGSNLDAPSDKEVGVLEFRKPSGELIALYVSYAMHPIDGYVVGVISGDFPEAMSRYVEKVFDDHVVVAFSQAPSGDQNPLYLRPSTNAMATRAGNSITGFDMRRETSEGPLRVADGAAAQHKGQPPRPADPRVVDDLFRFIESEGAIFGEEVIRVLSLPKTYSDTLRIAGAQKEISCPGRRRIKGDAFDPRTREGLQASYEDVPALGIQVGMLGLGTVAITSINSEIYTLIGTRIKMTAPMKDTMIVTLANARMGGYIPDDAAYGHETFQVLNSRLQPGCAERGIADAVVSLETEYLSQR